MQTPHRRALWLLGVISAVLMLAALVACADPYHADATPTPTRTPRPTATPTITPSPTPSPTPTPAWPLTVGCEAAAPASACARLRASVEADAEHFRWSDDPAMANVRLTVGASALGGQPVGLQVYAVAVPFFTLEDEVAAADVQATWSGQSTGILGGRPLLVSEATRRTLASVWGEPSAQTVNVVADDLLLAEAERLGGWTILPFDELNPRWKVLWVDGVTLLDKSFDPASYPLAVPLYLSTDRGEALSYLPADLSNWSAERMTVVAMTGVTAMTRGFGCWMDAYGNTYAAQDIRDLLAGADFTHISNEVSFQPDCPSQCSNTMSFCSKDSYIELLEYVGTDIIELTGNHLVDKGIEPLRHTLDLYRERGWQWYGGGENLLDASQPVTVTQGPNRIAFFGCNTVDNPYDWATDTLPGVYTCRSADSRYLDPEKLAQMEAQIRQLREQGYAIIITLQYYETEAYAPYPQQVQDFRTFAAMGADVVQGSQAHQPQTLEFYGDTFIHYGLGNLFFDQNWEEVRPSFIDRLIFYDGRLLSVDLRPTMMEEYGRRRPMTAQERVDFLGMLFALRPEGE